MTDWTPTVTVVTPAFNAQRFLAESLASTAAQTYTRWERIIVDDGSSDETLKIAQAAASSDPRIRVIALGQNQGVHAARNAAFQAARGRYIAFLDADDLWLPEKLERQLAFMERHGHAFTYHLYRQIDETGAVRSREPLWIPESVGYRDYLRLTGTIGCVTVMLDRHKVGAFQMEDIPAEDFVLWLRILERVRGHGLYEDLARYRVLSSSLSANKLKVLSWVWNVLYRREGLPAPQAAWYLSRYLARGVAKNLPLILGR